MKIAVLNNCVPFLRGGAEHLADALTAKLQEYGHEAVLIRVPFRWDPPEKIIEHMLACRLLRLPNVDRAIAIKFPAAYVPHPNKVLWLVHQFRQAYDFWGTEFQGLPNSVRGLQIRDAVTRADNNFFAEAKAIYTNSKVTGDRLRRFNGIESEVLLPPLFDPVVAENPQCGDFILCLGRVNGAKRQHLMVKAMKYCKTKVTLIVAGRPESEADAAQIRNTIRKDDLAQRVTFIDRFVSEKEKADLLSRCLAVAYIPYDEDSYGYVTLEACLSKKAVITCTDSGGIDALVRDRETGYIVPPEPKALADAMDSLYSEKSRAAAMGESGFELARSLNINWDHVIRTLTK
jgi:glycosyltransferase involved in cell wall biosynthesis